MDPWCKHKSWARLPTVVQENLPSNVAAEAPRVITGKGKGKLRGYDPVRDERFTILRGRRYYNIDNEWDGVTHTD